MCFFILQSWKRDDQPTNQFILKKDNLTFKTEKFKGLFKSVAIYIKKKIPICLKLLKFCYCTVLYSNAIGLETFFFGRKIV